MSYIIYNKQDNSVAIITSIGKENISNFFINFVNSIGKDMDTFGILQTDDPKVHTHNIAIEDNTIILGDSLVYLEPLTPSEADKLKENNKQLQIALAEFIEKEETDKVNNQIALAELVETLIIKGVL